MNTGSRLTRFIGVAVIKALITPVVLTFWVALLLQLAPPQPYSVAVILSGLIMSIVGGPIILRILAPRIKKWGLLWTDIMSPDEVSKGFYPNVGIVLLIIAAVGGAASLYFTLFFAGLEPTNPIVRFTPIIFIVLALVGISMLGGRNQVEAAQREDLEQEERLARPDAV